MTAPGFTAHGKQVLANGTHCADGATEIGAQHIADALNAWHAKGGWQPIETAPRDLRVLVWTTTEITQDDRDYVRNVCEGEHVIGAQVGIIGSGDDDWMLELIGQPTHWMPLPSAPVSA